MHQSDVIAASGKKEHQVTLVLQERITAYTAGPIWKNTLNMLAQNPDQPVIIDASGIETIDGVGIALLLDMRRQERPPGAAIEIRGLAPKFASLLEGYRIEDLARPTPVRAATGIIENIGRATAEQYRYAGKMLGFVRQCMFALWRAFTGGTTVRWREVRDVATEAGANAVPIVLLIGFLMGVIIAFQVALVAKQFGAVIFVVNGVGVAMLRELGPLMTAIVFAGRTGAAFAAQIGTQKVNEEINAMSTFGLDPVYFLVLPRLLAAMLVVPLLTVLADVIGVFGGALVMTSFDIGFTQFYNQLVGAVGIPDLLLGMFKALVFGFTVAVIGCERGLSTGAGATAVGLSATSTVVTSIVMIVVLDGLFALLTS
jgi:phospholipid/cholesterol/gamma-HCH transport system permease protein